MTPRIPIPAVPEPAAPPRRPIDTSRTCPACGCRAIGNDGSCSRCGAEKRRPEPSRLPNTLGSPKT